MPVKRKAPNGNKTTAKASKTARGSTPGPGTPRSIDAADSPDNASDIADDEEVDESIARNVASFDIAAHHRLPTGWQGDPASRLFHSRKGPTDFSYLKLKPDHNNRPMWIEPLNARIVLESFHPLAPQAQDFLVTIAEPQSRPTFCHEYAMTTHSLYAAVSVGLQADDILSTLNRFLKTPVPESIRWFILHSTKRFGKVKLVLKNNKYMLETGDMDVLQMLLKDPVIGPLRVNEAEQITTTTAPRMGGLVIAGTTEAAGVKQTEGAPATGVVKTAEDELYDALNEEDNDDEATVHSFQIADSSIAIVQKHCLDIGYPVLEEYDFRNDTMNANLEIDLQPQTQIRPYQEKSLSKMFGNGRAKSGIIVLPCGAGKTLVGITAACTIKKGVIVLATSNMSVIQWKNEFKKWSNINPDDIAVFSSDTKETFSGNTGIIVTTYSMVTNSRERAHDSKKMMNFLSGREWGLMILDEVHVVPANMFRKVTANIKAHSKLGLTATLLREDDKIQDLNFLIGPKLYEANWMELSQQGHIARVQCAEVWCPMPTEFYDEYLKASARKRILLYVMNPRKFQAAQYLINYHEARGDKIIVFSDDVYALESYARKLMKPYLYGGTSNAERQDILQKFRDLPNCNTIFLSKIGDTSLDLPEATCLIQISAQFGSRRQEAQRLGRILRAKRRNDAGFNAFFYSLVSKDTQEMYYSSKRQAFLVDQGYAFKVITQLNNIEKTPGLAFATATERRELLQKVLIEVESKGFKDEDEKEGAGLAADGSAFYQNNGVRRNKKAVRRTAGTLGDLSGGQDMAYIEQSKSANRALKSNKKKGPTNKFFKGIARENERRKLQNAD